MEGAQELMSRAPAPDGYAMAHQTGPVPSLVSVQVWDPLVRVFHWLLAAGIAVNYFELVRPGRYPHRLIGYVLLGLIAARVLWGFVGSHHARFRSFVAAPGKILTHLVALVRHRDRRTVGHNPAGGAMILTLLAAVALTGTTGWLCRTDWFFGVKWMKQTHELLANGVIALVGLHSLGVVHGCWRHRENLVLSMVTGRKRGPDLTSHPIDAPADR